VVSHRGAAWLLGLDGIHVQCNEVTVPQVIRLRAPFVIRSDDLDRAVDLTVVQGLPVTNATRTLCDLGAVVSADIVEMALESALRRGLTTVPRLRWRLGALARRGRAGPPILRSVLDRRAPRARPTANEVETRLLQILTAAGLPQPERQVPVGNGPRARKLDFAYPALKIAIEFDGFGTHGTPGALRRDLARQNTIVLAEWTILRYAWLDFWEDADRIASEVRAARAAAGALD
jgi:very-short-patch-repair endonuclease